MHDAPDMDLLQQYAQWNSDSAFATLVSRHVNMVYSAALRKTGSSHAAEDIAQAVFIILAKKAGALPRATILSGWLYQTAQLTAANFVRNQIRRAHREQEAYMQSLSNETEPNLWPQIAPHLEDAMGQLAEKDRNALALRFFDGKSYQEVATVFGTTENAAKKRVAYALEKLRKYFSKRGVVSTTAIIAGVVSANSVQAAPLGLAMTISATTAKGSAVAASVTTLANGTLKIMTFAKLKLAAGISAAMLLAGGAITVALSEQPNTFYSVLEKRPIVSNAVFEKELFIAGVPANARKQTFSSKLDGNNYVLSADGISTGRFGDLRWQKLGGNLGIYDPQWNKPEGGSGGLVETEAVTRMTVDLVLNWGIGEMKPGSAVREKGDRRFSAASSDGKKITLDIQEENGLPLVATILDGNTGEVLANVRYKYAPGFCEGKLPIEFTRYWGESAEETRKAYTVRMRTLEFSKWHLPKEVFDPAQVAKGSTSYFYSNNIVYSLGKNGSVSRVLTTEENKKEIEKLRNKPKK